LVADKNTFTAVVVGNIKCNMVLPQSIGAIAHESDASYLMVSGDMVFSGTSYEDTCVSSMAYHASHENSDLHKVTSAGNHSSDETEKEATKDGFTALDRKVVSIGDRTFLGDDSPRRSVIAQGTHAERRETEAEMGQKIAELACEQKQPVFAIMFNEPHAAESSTETGCATLIVAAGEETSVAETTHADGTKSWYVIAGNATGTKAGSINLGNPLLPKQAGTHRQSTAV
jgi:hypothetical protein